MLAGPPPSGSDGNAKAQAAIGVSPRELEVLHEIAAGRSNKEIAASLNVSPHTVKTHVARLFEKLGAKRRTEAINKVRELGIVLIPPESPVFTDCAAARQGRCWVQSQ